MASDRMMEYYYSMGQDCLHIGDRDEAVTYFRKAANLGAREAAHEIFYIGRTWEKGEDGERNDEKAETCYRVATDYGVSEAALALGKLYLRGISGRKMNPRKARRSLEIASEQGNAEAASLLGKMYDEGFMGRVDSEKAFHYYLLAAERGDSGAMLMTGMFYAQGGSTHKDLEAAEMWIRKGKEAGDIDGEMTLRGFLSVACGEYVTGAAGNRDIKKALSMAAEADKMGDEDVYLRLGMAFSHAETVEDHLKQAYQCYKKAAKHDNPAAWSALGLCYEAGLGIRASIKKAAEFYKKAAEAGDPFGMSHYGYALANGEGVKKDEKEAMNWLIKAAMKGDSGAIHILKEDYNYEI